VNEIHHSVTCFQLQFICFAFYARVRWLVRFFSWFWVAFLPFSMSVSAVTTITEQQVVEVFLSKNLPLLAGQAQIERSKAESVIASQLTNPNISLTVSGIGDQKNWAGGHSYWDRPYNNNVTLTQLIETAGKRQLRIQGAEWGVQAQQLLFEDLLRALKRDLLISYYQVVKDQQVVALYREILDKLNETSRANFLRLKAGDISETEYNRIEVAVLKAKTDVDQADLALVQSRQQLAELLVYEIQPNALMVSTQFPQYPRPNFSQQADWVARALSQRPDFQAADIQVNRQQTQLELAQKRVLPDVELGVQAVHDPSAASRDSLGVGVSVSLPLWHQYQGEVAQARADKRLSELALLQLKQQIKTQVLQSLAQYEQKERVLQRYNQDLIHRAAQIRASSLIAYQQGAISLLELLDAENNYRSTMLGYTQAQFDLVQAQLSFDYAIGKQEGK
jgi:cobalt-zinc-cadmium efflux system outer membrane protein